MLKPLADRVLVKVDEEETKTFISEIEALLGTKYESHR